MRFDVCAEIGERAVVVGEGAVELGLEAGVEPDLELRRGRVAERDQVAAHEDRTRTRGGEAQALGLRREPAQLLARLRVVPDLRPASLVVRLCHADQAVDAPDAQGQPPDGGVARVRLPECERLHVVRDERRHLLQDPLLVREAAQEGKRRLHARKVVPGRTEAPAQPARRRRLAEVVAENREADDQILVRIALTARPPFDAPPGKGVEAEARMVPDIPFRMPRPVLAAADEAVQFGVVAHPVRRAQEGEAAPDRDALREQLRPFLEEPFGRESFRRHRAADRDRLLRGGEVEAGDELHAPEDTQGILHELLRDMAEDAPP